MTWLGLLLIVLGVRLRIELQAVRYAKPCCCAIGN